MISYRQAGNASTGSALVIISTVDFENLYAEGQVAGDGPIYRINLAYFQGPIATAPRTGQEWLIARVGNDWTLAGRSTRQNGVVELVRAADEGDIFIGEEGNVVKFPGEVVFQENVTFMGTTGVPAGSMVNWATPTPPAGWVVCDGTALSRTVYADLFAAIGTFHGAGNGTTTFNLPNMTGRVAVGVNPGLPALDTVGEIGGSASASVGNHTHTLDAGFANVYQETTGVMSMRRVSTASWTENVSWTATRTAGTAVARAAGAQLDGSTDAAGAHSVSLYQPFMALLYIIKT